MATLLAPVGGDGASFRKSSVPSINRGRDVGRDGAPEGAGRIAGEYDPLEEAAAASSGHALDHGHDRSKSEHDRLAQYLMEGHIEERNRPREEIKERKVAIRGERGHDIEAKSRANRSQSKIILKLAIFSARIGIYTQAITKRQMMSPDVLERMPSALGSHPYLPRTYSTLGPLASALEQRQRWRSRCDDGEAKATMVEWSKDDDGRAEGMRSRE
ncbi:hypothetical protein Sjap_013310 [Stephania japonica]|uniref:Uncharacterized protein n=1 Tax=Stephania japonica TaxID=461633 RepID=A0AAP0IZG5_9MAGN